MILAVKTASKGLRPQNPPARVKLNRGALGGGESAQADLVAERP